MPTRRISKNKNEKVHRGLGLVLCIKAFDEWDKVRQDMEISRPKERLWSCNHSRRGS
jgi:hypothetical protein